MPLECDHIRNEFSALLDNELNSEDRELVEEHLSECADCLRELHGFKQVSDAYRYHHPVKAPDNFEELFRAALEPAVQHRKGWATSGLVLAAAATVTLVSGLALWQVGTQAPDEILLSRQSAESQSMGEAPALFDGERAAGKNPAPQADALEAPVEERMMQREFFAAESAAAPPETDEDTAMNGARGFSGGGGGLGGGGGGFGASAPAVADTSANPGASVPAPAPPPASPAVMNEVTTNAVDLAEVPDAPAEDATGAEPVAPQALFRTMKAPEKAENEGAPAASFPKRSADQSPAAATEALPMVAEEREELTPETAEAPVNEANVTRAPRVWRQRSFVFGNGIWRESTYTDQELKSVSIPSSGWNALLDRFPDLTKLCSDAAPVIVELDKSWYRIERMTPES